MEADRMNQISEILENVQQINDVNGSETVIVETYGVDSDQMREVLETFDVEYITGAVEEQFPPESPPMGRLQLHLS